jgi:hypothetical protein
MLLEAHSAQAVRVILYDRCEVIDILELLFLEEALILVQKAIVEE